jgi:hypothetical protein
VDLTLFQLDNLDQNYPGIRSHFLTHVVCIWIGNSERIAREHYLQVTDDHFAKALQNPMQQPAVLPRNASQEATEGESIIDVTSDGCGLLQKKTTECESQSIDLVHPAGFEPEWVSACAGNDLQFPKIFRAAKCDANETSVESNPDDLLEVIKSWPKLTRKIKKIILHLVQED